MNRLIWFRNDLRLSDNETLKAAIDGCEGSIVYLYIHDQSLDHSTPENFERMGAHRKKFLAESIRDLQAQLRSKGADLCCLVGDPVLLIPRLCQRLQINSIYHSRLTAQTDRRVENILAKTLETEGIAVHRFQTHTLLHDDDLEYDPFQLMSFSKRRKLVEESSWPVRAPLEEPTHYPKAIPISEEPRWDFESAIVESTEERGVKVMGGERSALTQMATYFQTKGLLNNYKNTRNGLIEFTDSSKFSPALSLGCVSARRIYQEVRRHEQGGNLSSLWFLYELLWRDHFHFLAKGRGARLFTEPLSLEHSGFEEWQQARTGNQFIDAAMNELKQTGWLSNRMRQNAASFLIHDKNVDWRMGARWFESCLIDYDPCSNWGNWAYIAGADVDRKPHRFDIEQQANMYDRDHSYRNLWYERYKKLSKG